MRAPQLTIITQSFSACTEATTIASIEGKLCRQMQYADVHSHSMQEKKRNQNVFAI